MRFLMARPSMRLQEPACRLWGRRPRPSPMPYAGAAAALPASLSAFLPPRPLPEPFELRLLVRGRESSRRAERPGAAPRYEGSCSGDGGGKEARVLREAPQARPPGPEGVLRDVEGMLDGAAHGGLRRFGRQVFPRERGAPLRHMPGDSCEARAGGCPSFRADMAGIGPDALVALPHEVRQPAQVVDVGRIGVRAVGDAALRVRPDAELVPEVPVLAPLRLVRRNRASLWSSWWGMGPPRRRHPRWCCGHLEPAARRRLRHGIERPRADSALLGEMAEPAERRRIGGASRHHADEPPHRRGAPDLLLACEAGEAEACLHHVHPGHRGVVHAGPSHARPHPAPLRIGLPRSGDERLPLLPGAGLVGLGQEACPARRPRPARLHLEVREGGLPIHAWPPEDRAHLHCNSIIAAGIWLFYA